MRTILIDTDIAIDYLRGSQDARGLITPLWEGNRAYLSVLSVYELHAGMKSGESNYTEDFVDACRVELITVQIAKKAGEMYRNWRAKGITLTSIQCLIAATALINRHKIATRNKNHYPEKGLLL